MWNNFMLTIDDFFEFLILYVVRVKCLAQEHHTMSPARARTRTARSGVERTNHEATASQNPS